MARATAADGGRRARGRRASTGSSRANGREPLQVELGAEQLPHDRLGLHVVGIDAHAARRCLDPRLAAADDVVQATFAPEVRPVGAEADGAPSTGQSRTVAGVEAPPYCGGFHPVEEVPVKRALVAVAVAGVLVAGASSPAPAAAKLERQVAALQRQVTSLRKQVTTLKRQVTVTSTCPNVPTRSRRSASSRSRGPSWPATRRSPRTRSRTRGP